MLSIGLPYFREQEETPPFFHGLSRERVRARCVTISRYIVGVSTLENTGEWGVRG